MKIGILQTGHAPAELIETTGDNSDFFQRLLQDQGFQFETFDVVDMEFPPSALACDGWLLTGSKHGAYDDLPFIPPLEDFIRAAYEQAVPMVGICFGHQIIAQALGGKVEKFKDGWAVGRQSYELDGETVHLNAWHQDQVVEKPADATVCASNGFCENAALVYGDRAFTVQAHPEFNASYIASLVKYRGQGVVPDDLLTEATDNLEKPTDNALLARKIAAFFRREREVAA